MADDERSFIEQVQSRNVGFTGKELTPDEMVTEFAKWPVADRVKALEEIRADRGELKLSEAMKRIEYESGLQAMHTRLLRVNR